MTGTAQKPKSVDLEESILAVASDLLAEGGPEALSMRVIADRVGVSATAIYHYFKGKQDLVDRVVDKAFRHMCSYLDRKVEDLPVGSIGRIRALGEGYIEFATEHRSYFSVLLNIGHGTPRPIEDLPGGGGFRLLRDSVSAAMEAGNLRTEDPDLLSIYLWAVVQGIVTLAMAGRLESCENFGNVPATATELYHRIHGLVMEGLASPSARGSDVGSATPTVGTEPTNDHERMGEADK